ncbi:MAG: ABC transporter substrate-binding protein [Actinobacteria bacterium 13_2_20CM_2_71_6]|nr:MAG: ABC transporter substrate-binding protein [Actinobacteria bacterium 13_2_20CM_2_71_6]
MGTLYWLTEKDLPTLDPQRVYAARDIANLGRTVYRGFVQFPATGDPAVATVPVPDLATDTGTSVDGGRSWTFTLKEDVRWEDGRPITAEDLRYGVSRAFAAEVLSGGPTFPVTFLDVPRGGDGRSVYAGPYGGGLAGRAEFERAVACSPDGRTITYHFNRPWVDFPYAVASLRCFDPYRADRDRGAASNYDIFASGPYRLDGEYRPHHGWSLIRNPHYDPATDGVRRARPDRIVFREGPPNEVITDRLIADEGDDRYAVTDRLIPPSRYDRIVGEVARRAVNPVSPFVEYLLLNVERLTDPLVRRALKVATDAAAWIEAGGGAKASEPAYSVIAPGVRGYRPTPAFSGPPGGDPEAARTLLREAGVPLPYPVKFSYPGGNATGERQAAALKAGWDRAGFAVRLNPCPGEYHEVVQDPADDSDVIWAAWGADWPTPATVLPPIFDHRLNLTPTGNGQDYGRYRSDTVAKLIDEAAAAPTTADALPIYQRIDAQLGEDVAYIPLDVAKFYLLRGSRVTGYRQTLATGMYPDLGALGVRD